MTDTLSEEAWFYTLAGQRRGPVPAETIRGMLTAKTIDGETPIWRKGFEDWKLLRDTEFRAAALETPPPVAATQLSNNLVWALAVMPIAYAIVQALLQDYLLQHPDDQTFVTLLYWMIPLAVNSGLCLLDDRQLREAGYQSPSRTFFAVVLAPVYLFMRAKTLRQKPTYGFVWIGCLILSLFIDVALSPQ